MFAGFIDQIKLSTKYICVLGKSSLDKAKPKPASWLTCEGSGEGGRGGGTKRIQTSRREGNKGSEGKSEPARKKARDRGAGGTRAP